MFGGHRDRRKRACVCCCCFFAFVIPFHFLTNSPSYRLCVFVRVFVVKPVVPPTEVISWCRGCAAAATRLGEGDGAHFCFCF
ncbi:hypothetical protein TRSC58_07232 [Trypanosoma rangeli SC58]|uniref:Uncharacterized protein n=1 Tax=Trypanosoma rangeli SC58 TaxID=429131 RepID=A0A061IRR7_TRYRA|nr:hypothetical protein TRSC58_07232 [Trypanosoma rangeli SC58]